VLRDENATVLPFRDSALRRPIDVVAWMTPDSWPVTKYVESHDNVVSLAPFTRAAFRGAPWSDGSPGGEAA